MSSSFMRSESKIEEACLQYESHVYRVADKIFDYFDAEDHAEMTEMCQEAMKRCCHLQQEFKHNQNIVKATAERLKVVDNEKTAKKIFKELKEKVPFKPPHGKNESYKNLQRIIKNAENRVKNTAEPTGEDEEMELCMTDVQLNTKDPFTQCEMEDPVMSKVCQHTFERSSIMSVLKNKPRVKCPTPGCGYITVKDLVPNTEMKRLIEERRVNSKK